MDKENIYIDSNEDIQSVIQKIQSAETENLDLMVPTGARILQNIVDAHLIKEAGDESGKVLTMVTSDLMGRIFAERAGLAVSGRAGAEVVTTKTLSGTGRISDIIPRKKTAPADFLSINNSPSLKPLLAKAKTSISKSAQSGKTAEKKSGNFFAAKSKGETGANFLKSYREERFKTNVFKDLSQINKKKSFRSFRFKPSYLIGGVAVAALVIGFVVFGQTLPRADVTIYPSREIKVTAVDVLISSENSVSDFSKGIISGELLTLEKSETGEFSATGIKDVSEKAKGKITVYNTYSSQPQNLIVSRFQTEDGKIFWTTKSLTVPGAVIKDGQTTPGQIGADVVAAEPGETYNIGPAKFTMPALKGTPKGEKIYAVSEVAMAGGKTGRSSVVSADDITKASGELKDKLKPQFNDFKTNLPNDFQFWPEAYNEELADSSTSPELGVSAEKFKASIKMVARAVVFKTKNLDDYINQELFLTLNEDKMLLTLSKEISFLKPPVVDYQKGTVLASLSVKYDVIDKLDTESFTKEILNKQEKEIKRIFSVYKNIDRVEVKLSPFWVRTLPSNPERVKIKIVGL
ncbi:MAG: hypothetical protein HYV66_01215 [Candidatus Sungbacteria bacterium]|uniref:Baseplate protein J-like domain-containing protein n=1 Tax=Candidatus Sungiibacteriota bacterium TaxID=2750080 RepID=A0A931YDB2_9BACT|nr:hypothetical protein [Candidatus Sungbacteria bacterium]